MRVVVIGAGVVGAAVAAGLTRRGAQVTVLEARTPGAGTSSTSVAWVNANNKTPRAYFDLNQAAVWAHHQLAGDHFFPTGNLECAATDEHRELLEARVTRLIGMGYPVERVTARRALALEPDLVPPPPGTEYVFFPGEAYVHPLRLLGRLLGEARDGGATLECGAEVSAIEASASGAKVTVADGRTFAGDAVVTCAGRWTQHVAALAGLTVPMLDPAVSGTVTNGFLVTTSPVPARLSRVLTTAGLNLRPDGEGGCCCSPCPWTGWPIPPRRCPRRSWPRSWRCCPACCGPPRGPRPSGPWWGSGRCPATGSPWRGSPIPGGGCTRWPRTAGSRWRRC
ncbi:NAD(P)/FAD-dependent oxidoreductase [Nonomuraea rubra]|uniref:NAD(P)/FAD-dependent oxidoreductase n=1 Tax=Nonomuraea rubra TaxID=46180 RepID=UPI0036169651